MPRKLLCALFVLVSLVSGLHGAILTITISGVGTVSPNLNGQDLEVGKMYSLTAKPGTGYFFTGWSGSITSKIVTLSFVMQTNTVLQANFVPNPFIGRKGIYTGLYAVTSAPPGTVAGAFAITVSDLGTFTGSLQVQDKKVKIAGQFGLSGTAGGVITVSPGIAAVLYLDLFATSGVTGTLASGSAVAEIRANRPGFDRSHPCPQVGFYTMIIPGAAGDGYAAVTVDGVGTIKAAGKLADGRTFTQSAVLAADGSWPFVVSLPKGGGLAWAWMSFTNRAESDFGGSLTWIHPGPSGTNITVTADARGSKYNGLSGGVVDFSDGLVTLTGGGLPESFDAAVTLMSNNKVLYSAPAGGPDAKLKMQIKTTTGIFTGSLIPPALGRPIKFQGAIFQKDNSGAGFFLNGSQSGEVRFGPSVVQAWAR